jgi:hypothetical protein
VAARWLFSFSREQLPNLKLLLTCLVASTLTLPILWFVMPLVIHDYGWYILLGELLVVIVEAIIYFLILKKDLVISLLISLICNLFSIIIGSLIL